MDRRVRVLLRDRPWRRPAWFGFVVAIVVAACGTSDGSAERQRLAQVRGHALFEIAVEGGEPGSIIATSGRAGDRESATRASRTWRLDRPDDASFATFVGAAIDAGLDVTRLVCIDSQSIVSGLLAVDDGTALVTLAMTIDPPVISALVSLGHDTVEPEPQDVVVQGTCPEVLSAVAATPAG